MEIIKASELKFNPRVQMGKIFADGFYEQGLKFINSDKTKLAKALAHTFILENFYLAVNKTEIMAFIGCKETKPPPVKLDKKIFIKEFGFFRGRFAYWALNKFLLNQPYPFVMPPKSASIEFIATAEEHRGKGAAFELINNVMKTLGYDTYVLEVIDTNIPAIKLYEKLGFSEFTRKKAVKGSGFNFHLYMKK